MKQPFLILETGQPVASMRRHGNFPHWIRVAAGLEREDAVVANVERGDALPRRRGLRRRDRHRLGGDGHRASRLERAFGRLAARSRARRLPLFGICYGHQLLAHALGGEVGDNPAGREMGTIDLELHPHAADDPLFAGLPLRFPAQATHLQTVLRAPEGATVLAQSTQDACHAFRWRDRVWGVQFHPEFSGTHMRGYVRARHDALAAEGRCAKQVRATSAPRRTRARCCAVSCATRALCTRAEAFL